MPQPSIVHSHLFGRQVRPMAFTAADVTATVMDELRLIGIDLSDRVVARMVEACDGAPDVFGLDAAPDLQPLVGVAGVGAPIQFLQSWLPGFVNIITAARKIDEIVGITTVGSWEDEEVIQGIMEPTGLAQPYADHTAVPLASWNINFERRSIIRFEQGFEVGRLEERRTARIRVNTAAAKRNGSTLALEIQRNRMGFYGYNAGNGRTFGFLNDPNLPAYVTVANGGGGTPGWATKTFLEIIADFRSAMGALQVAGQGNIDPRQIKATMVIPTVSATYLSVTSDFGVSVEDWVKKTYPNLRIVDAPELAGANGGVNVFYIFADAVQDGMSDDGGQTFIQMVPAKFMTLGAETRLKTYVEAFTNAVAGVMLKRPYAVVRRSGI